MIRAAEAAAHPLRTTLRRPTTVVERTAHREEIRRKCLGVNRRNQLRRLAQARNDTIEGAVAPHAKGKAGVARGTGRTNGAPVTTTAAAAPAAVVAPAGGAPNGEVGLKTGRTGASVAEAAAAATREAEVEVTGDEGVAQGVPNVQAGEKTGVRAEVGGVDTVLRAQGRVRDPVAKTETDETLITGAVCLFLNLAAHTFVALKPCFCGLCSLCDN